MGLEIAMYIGLFILSLAALLRASDWFVSAAERIGLSLGISPFIIGVTIIAFGTSLPELAASIVAVFANESEIVIGNVVGSNITNILLVLGLVAIVAKKVELNDRVRDLDVPLLVGSSILMWFALNDQVLSFGEALLFLAGLTVFLINSFKGEDDQPKIERIQTTWKSYGMLVLSGVVVYFGANYTIIAIQKISQLAQIDSEFIALSLVALGTSLPEVVVSITAARRGKPAIAVGNVLGSNIFNTYAVMAIPSFFGELKIPDNIINFSLPFMVAITLLFGITCVSKRISRWEGVMLLVFYVYFFVEIAKAII
jgi:cation:H+ antiporter